MHVFLARGCANIHIVALLVYLLSAHSAFPSPLFTGDGMHILHAEPHPQKGCFIGQNHRADTDASLDAPSLCPLGSCDSTHQNSLFNYYRPRLL